jgi:hypothetical protein
MTIEGKQTVEGTERSVEREGSSTSEEMKEGKQS